jgi:hypothetical protein
MISLSRVDLAGVDFSHGDVMVDDGIGVGRDRAGGSEGRQGKAVVYCSLTALSSKS